MKYYDPITQPLVMGQIAEIVPSLFTLIASSGNGVLFIFFTIPNSVSINYNFNYS